MEKFILPFEKILTEINNSINEKIIGTNFLEIFKYQLIEKLFTEDIIKYDDLRIINNSFFEKDFFSANRNLKYKLEYFDKSVVKIKEKVSNNYLYIVLDGLMSITIFDNIDEKKQIFSKLSKKMGLVLSLNSTINATIAEKSIILSISIN